MRARSAAREIRGGRHHRDRGPRSSWGRPSPPPPRSWPQRRRATFVRTATLAELAADELKGPLRRADLDTPVHRLGLQVATQLATGIGQRFAALPDNEGEAALLAVGDRPLSGKSLAVTLGSRQEYVGLEDVGPEARIRSSALPDRAEGRGGRGRGGRRRPSPPG
ncbi:hypothetical protein [Amycolatopsis arida]|uniref:NACHT N-terminal Helical domain 1-containing protein n=1 Tax=Amycolatopsis arida TaxID=587909 RepID=UPI003C7E6DD9